MTDDQREDFVANDEGLYNLQQASGLNEEQWVRENRELIDEVMGNVESGRKRQHYLVYG